MGGHTRAPRSCARFQFAPTGFPRPEHSGLTQTPGPIRKNNQNGANDGRDDDSNDNEDFDDDADRAGEDEDPNDDAAQDPDIKPERGPTILIT